ncbi:MAG: hypothetical protein ABIH78_05005 [Candidatus Peregrinibacteria bacterium]
MASSFIQTEWLEACNSPINSFESKYCGNMNEYFEKGEADFWVYDITLQPFAALIPSVYSALHTVDDVYSEYYNELVPPYNDFILVTSPWLRLEIDTYTSYETKPITALLGKIIIWMLHFVWWAALAMLATKSWNHKNTWARRAVIIFMFDKLVLNVLVCFVLSFL